MNMSWQMWREGSDVEAAQSLQVAAQWSTSSMQRHHGGIDLVHSAKSQQSHSLIDAAAARPQGAGIGDVRALANRARMKRRFDGMLQMQHVRTLVSLGRRMVVAAAEGRPATRSPPSSESISRMQALRHLFMFMVEILL
jgi:hypothetical protein